MKTEAREAGIGGRERTLHSMYHRGAALQHWFSRRIRPAGIGLCLVLTLAAFLSAGQPRDSVFQIFSFAFGLALLCLGWVALRRAKLTAEHELPRHATVGEPLRYTLKVVNKGRRKLASAWLEESPPDPRPSREDFATLREPGEETRNFFDRNMAYYRWQWLRSRNRSFTTSGHRDSLRLAPNEIAKVRMELTPLRRGVIAMNDVRVLLPDPLGLFQKCRKVESLPSRLVVLPKRYALPNFVMPGSAAFQIGGEETSNAIGTSGEFVGLREYRSGDPLRQIHWKSWAHTGRPMVKELEDSHYPRYALILDTFPNSTDEAVFEDMISVAASFVVGLDRHDSLLDLMFVSDQAHMVTAGRGLERTEKLLEVLAAARLEGTARYESLSKLVIRHREKMTSSLVVLNGWDRPREDFVKGLLRVGIVCVPLVVGPGPAPQGLIGYWLESGHIARDLTRLPAILQAAGARA